MVLLLLFFFFFFIFVVVVYNIVWLLLERKRRRRKNHIIERRKERNGYEGVQLPFATHFINVCVCNSVHLLTKALKANIKKWVHSGSTTMIWFFCLCQLKKAHTNTNRRNKTIKYGKKIAGHAPMVIESQHRATQMNRNEHF